MTQNCSCHGSGGKYSQTVAAILERPRYSPGLILEDKDLTSAVDYTQSLSRLLFRNLFGCGVICGLVVKVDEDCGLQVTVAAGLALDGCGDPIEVPRPITISLDRNEVERLEGLTDPEKKKFWVVLCGKEKLCAPRSLVCESDDFDGVTQPTRIRALAEVSLAFERPQCVCECQRGDRTDAPVQPQADAAAGSPHATPPRTDDEVDCHYDHETRVECVPDCGCGTACACGCCVLLGLVEHVTDAAGTGGWKATNRGIRRFIRPWLLADPADRGQDTGWRQAAVARDFYWKDIDDSNREEAASALFPDMEAGDVLDGNQVRQMIAWTAERRAARNAAAAAGAAAAEAAKPAKAAKAAKGEEKPE